MLTPFSSYCDEFGSAADPAKKYMGIAGLLATVEKWKTFDAEWRGLFNRESIPSPFHMVDFVHAKEDFGDKRWADRVERIRIMRLLLDVIAAASIIPVAAAVVLQDFNELSETHRSRLKGPYFAAFQEVTYNLAFGCAISALSSPDVDMRSQVEMFYAKAKKLTGPAESWWHAIKEHNPHVGWIMGSYTPAEPKAVSALQAADIFAYSIGHTGEFSPSKHPEANMASSLFDNLVTLSPGHKCFTILGRKELLQRLGDWDDANEE